MKPRNYDTLSLAQQSCADMLADWVCGWHHLPKLYEFGDGVCINFHGDLSTFDFDRLTTLVLFAHRDAIRVEVASSGPGRVKVIAHKRRPRPADKSERVMHKDHPTLNDLIHRITALQ